MDREGWPEFFGDGAGERREREPNWELAGNSSDGAVVGRPTAPATVAAPAVPLAVFDVARSDGGTARFVSSSSSIHQLPVRPLLTKPTPAEEAWKLICLVLVFLAWVGTAGALLFRYMDRYLFG